MTGITKSDIATVMENKAVRSEILSMKDKASVMLIDASKRKPKSIPAKVVSTALSRRIVP